MKKSVKITLIVVLAVVLVLAALYGVVYFRWLRITGQLGDDVSYIYNERTKTAVIYGSGDMWAFEETYVGYYGSFLTYQMPLLSPFYADPSNPPRYCYPVNTVIIMEGVTNIPPYLIEPNSDPGCSLERVYIPASVTHIGMYLFTNQKKFTDVYFAGNAPEPYEESNDFICWKYPDEYPKRLSKPTIHRTPDSTGWDTSVWPLFPQTEEDFHYPNWLQILFWKV